MKRILVYVDAENLTVEQFKQVRKDICVLNCCVIGKFYGNAKELGAIKYECYRAGYDFVDTSGISHSAKNVTDMKITVDCITDVMCAFCEDVDAVWILSNDHDFLPLIYKLMGRGLDVRMPLLQDILDQKTLADVNKFLESHCFASVARERVCEGLVPLYKDVTKEAFPYSLILDYVEQKKMRYLRSIITNYDDSVSADVDSIPVESFGFAEVIKALPIMDLPEKLEALDNYTRRVFGISLTKADAIAQLSAMEVI